MPVRIDFTSNKKRICATYAQAKLAKKVAGASFRRTSKDWTFPLTIETCRDMRQVFGPEMRVSAELGEWARAQIAHAGDLEAARTGLAAPGLARVGREAPGLSRAILARRYQALGSAWLSKGPGGLLGDDPGLGKTLQALGAVVESDSHRILVSCPKTACRIVWEDHVNHWTPFMHTYVAQGTRGQRQAIIDKFLFESDRRPGQHMLIINTEMMRMQREICPDGPLKKCEKEVTKRKTPIVGKKFTGEQAEPHRHQYDVAEWPELSDVVWDAIIIDESHNALASMASTRSKNTTQIRYGAMAVRRMLRKDGLPIAMSGTPFRSRLTKSWGTLNWVAPNVFTSFWAFAERNFGADWTQGKRAAPEPLDWDRFSAELRPFYLARTKEEVAPDLPPIVWAGTPSRDNPDGPNAVWVDMDPKQQELYEEMRDYARARLENGEVTAVGVLAEITRLRQFALSAAYLDDDEMVHPMLPSAKFEWLLEFLREREDGTGKVVVASAFTKLINLASAELSKLYPIAVITGETSQKRREEAVREFQDEYGEPWIMLINMFAGGEGITIDRADDMVLLDVPWTSDQEKQVISRIHRVSRIHSVTAYRLLTPGTVEENMANASEEQRRILKSLKPQAVDIALEMIS
jgi:SNF2 family DNA or RNA helicase